VAQQTLFERWGNKLTADGNEDYFLNLHLGARPDLKNNDRKTPYDLAKDPQTAALLQHAG